jgi:hypothetical protein
VFATDDRVDFDLNEVSGSGTILGLSSSFDYAKFWIVLLDEPIKDERGLWRALVIPESCIRCEEIRVVKCVDTLSDKAEVCEEVKDHPSFGPMATASLERSANYWDMSSEEQWQEDKRLGILDWDGDPSK